MAEIMLALGRDYIKPFKDLGSSEISSTFGVKILTNEQYSFKTEDALKRRGYPAVSKFVRLNGAEKVMVDARISNDTKSEVADAVSTIVSEVMNPQHPGKNPVHRQKQPEYLSAGVDISQSSMEAFIENCRKFRVAPVVHLTSSRFTDVDFENRGTTAEKNAILKSKLAMNSGFYGGAVICAAADAEAVKNVNPDFMTFATGAMLADHEDVEPLEFRHERPALIEEVSEFVDVFIIGAPIFHAHASPVALKERIEAVAA